MIGELTDFYLTIITAVFFPVVNFIQEMLRTITSPLQLLQSNEAKLTKRSSNAISGHKYMETTKAMVCCPSLPSWCHLIVYNSHSDIPLDITNILLQKENGLDLSQRSRPR